MYIHYRPILLSNFSILFLRGLVSKLLVSRLLSTLNIFGRPSLMTVPRIGWGPCDPNMWMPIDMRSIVILNQLKIHSTSWFDTWIDTWKISADFDPFSSGLDLVALAPILRCIYCPGSDFHGPKVTTQNPIWSYPYSANQTNYKDLQGLNLIVKHKEYQLNLIFRHSDRFESTSLHSNVFSQ